jgi:hypothetical protein
MLRSPASAKLTPTLAPSQQFLIFPPERLRFTLLFILATGFGWAFTTILFHSVHDPILQTYLAEQGLIASFVTGFVSGLIVSAAQWLILRRYLPDCLWILASAVGYVLLTTTLEAGWNWIAILLRLDSVVSWLNGLSPLALPILSSSLRTVVTAICAIWLGGAQWLLIRHYSRSSAWWIGTPSIAVLLSAGIMGLSALLPGIHIILPLEPSVLGAGVLGTTQAIAACMLWRKSGNVMLGNHRNPLVAAPEILRYGQVQTLARELYRQLNHTWIQESAQTEPLTYLVGVTDGGAIAAYQPINPVASNQVAQTPLPSMVIPELIRQVNGKAQPLARFNVSFLPSGGLKIAPWRGIPLLWLTCGLFTSIIVLSAIAAYVLRVIIQP